MAIYLEFYEDIIKMLWKYYEHWNFIKILPDVISVQVQYYDS